MLYINQMKLHFENWSKAKAYKATKVYRSDILQVLSYTFMGYFTSFNLAWATLPISLSHRLLPYQIWIYMIWLGIHIQFRFKNLVTLECWGGLVL